MKKNNHLEPHELALLFPPLEKGAAAELAIDIKLNGQRDDITLFEGKILDGIQRYGACLDAEVEPETTPFELSDAFHKGMHPVDFVMSKNFHRRHLTQGQKAVVKIAYEKLRQKKFPTLEENVDRANKAYKEQVLQNDKRAVEFVAARKQSGRKRRMPKSQRQMGDEVGVHYSVISKAATLAERSPRKFEQVRVGNTSLDDALESLPPTVRQKKNAEERAEKLRAGLTLSDTIGKLRAKAKRNGGQIYVELGGYGFRCFQLCRR
jgi:hypothetical protein